MSLCHKTRDHENHLANMLVMIHSFSPLRSRQIGHKSNFSLQFQKSRPKMSRCI